MRIGVVSARFNASITDPMTKRAVGRIEEQGHTHAGTIRVPGAYDTPLAAQRMLERDDVEGVVVIGCVITGETDHDQVLMHATSRTLQELSLRLDKPLAFAITGPGMTRAQAQARVDYAAQGVDSLLSLAAALDGEQMEAFEPGEHRA